MSDISYVFEVNKTYAKTFQDSDSLRFRILKSVLILILVALIFELIFYFIVLPSISNARIMLNLTGSSLTEREVVGMIGLNGETKWINIDASKIKESLMREPLVESVSVTKKFPDKLFVDVVERQPVAVSFVNIGGTTLPLEIDKEGVVFRIGWNEKVPLLTIVSGLNFQNPRVGMKLSYKLSSLFSRLDAISKTNPILLSGISEIKIREKKFGDYDLIMYPIHTKVKVFADKDFSDKTLSRMMLVLDIVHDETVSRELEYVDIRGTNVVYKWKELEYE
ncbi:MAG: cell division protein FtsQ/DivIB [Treponema sp.]